METNKTKIETEKNKFVKKKKFTEETKTTEENKSLLSKTKDTLMGLKNQAEEFFFSKKQDEKIQGMSRLEFEATKAKLESILHFKKQKDLPQQQQQFEATSNVESVKKEGDISRFGSETISGANINQKYEKVDKHEFAKAPEILGQRTEFHDDKKDEIKYSKTDKDEVHVLPTLHVEEKPVIVEKEIQYEKPVEIKQTIIHKEQPVIIEQPIIKETHEHYREATDYQKKDTKIVKETISDQDVGNQDTEALLNLRKERLDQHNDTAPIVHKEKQFVQLDTEVREQPTEVHEKQVVYQQPVEIQKTHIEKIKPKVREEVTLEKEHIHEKLAPEVYQEDVKKAATQQQYYSQDAAATGATTTTTTATASTVPADNFSTVTNDTTTVQRDANADADLRIAGEQKKKQQLA